MAKSMSSNLILCWLGGSLGGSSLPQGRWVEHTFFTASGLAGCVHACQVVCIMAGCTAASFDVFD